MEASIVDLRYKMKDVLQSLDRNENVKIYYHGKLKGIIYPSKKKMDKKSKKKIVDHPFFGMLKAEKESVEEIMNQLRDVRYYAV